MVARPAESGEEPGYVGRELGRGVVTLLQRREHRGEQVRQLAPRHLACRGDILAVLSVELRR